MSGIQLVQGDCLEKMKEIPDKSIDMILCDLPYGATQNKWDSVIPFEPLWEQYHRVCKPNVAIVLHCQQPFTTQLIISNPKEFKYCWIWYKHYARGFLNAKKRPLKVHEDIAVFYRKQCIYNPQMKKGKLRSKGNSEKQRGCYGNYNAVRTVNDIYYPQSILNFAGCANSELLHPTQKPVPLLEYLIKTYTNEGETVLDNAAGSMSTVIACINTNRNCIAIEKDEHYFSVGCKRVHDHIAKKRIDKAVEDK